MKVSELKAGATCDALVALAQDLPLSEEWNCVVGDGIFIGKGDGGMKVYSPSTNGAQCFELIEIFNVEILDGFPDRQGVQRKARLPLRVDIDWQYSATTKLAVCKAVIASKFGDTIPCEIMERLR